MGAAPRRRFRDEARPRPGELVAGRALGRARPPFGLERPVDLDQHLLLPVVQRRVVEQGVDHVRGVVGALVEDAGPHVERLGRDAQALGDRLQDLGRRLAEAPLDLAEVRVRDAGRLAQLAQREAGVAALVADELAEIVQPRLERVRGHQGVPATCRDAISRSNVSITPWSWWRISESSRSKSRRRSDACCELGVVERRKVRERRVGDELLAAVGPVQLDRRRLRARDACRRRGRAPAVGAEDARQVGDELVEAAAAFAPGPLGFEDLHARLHHPAVVGDRQFVLRAATAHRTQVVERACGQRPTGIQDRGADVCVPPPGRLPLANSGPGRSGTGPRPRRRRDGSRSGGAACPSRSPCRRPCRSRRPR